MKKYSEAKMLEVAQLAREKAYAPYSNFKVGVCMFGDDHQYYGGCNIENASYPQSQCAEPTAMGNLRVAGGHYIEAVLVLSDTPEGIFPCGGCLQRMSEFVRADTPILIANIEGIVQRKYFHELFNMQFTSFFSQFKQEKPSCV